jgi:hypothetical protein
MRSLSSHAIDFARAGRARATRDCEFELAIKRARIAIVDAV